MGSIQVNEMSSKAFPAGISVPSLTWFLDDAGQEIDWATQKKHLEFLVSSGLHGSKDARNNMQFEADKNSCASRNQR